MVLLNISKWVNFNIIIEYFEITYVVTYEIDLSKRDDLFIIDYLRY